MNQTIGTIDANVHLHAKNATVALLGLVHIGVSCLVFVLGRAGRGDGGGVHDGATGELEAALEQQSSDLGKHRQADLMFFQQVTEVQQCERRLAGGAIVPFESRRRSQCHLLHVLSRRFGSAN